MHSFLLKRNLENEVLGSKLIREYLGCLAFEIEK